jgi:hypothetical protein
MMLTERRLRIARRRRLKLEGNDASILFGTPLDNENDTGVGADILVPKPDGYAVGDFLLVMGFSVSNALNPVLEGANWTSEASIGGSSFAVWSKTAEGGSADDFTVDRRGTVNAANIFCVVMIALPALDYGNINASRIQRSAGLSETADDVDILGLTELDTQGDEIIIGMYAGSDLNADVGAASLSAQSVFDTEFHRFVYYDSGAGYYIWGGIGYTISAIPGQAQSGESLTRGPNPPETSAKRSQTYRFGWS